MSKHLPSPFTIFPHSMLSVLDSTFWNYNNSKFSFPELSHRSQHYANINHKAQEHIRAYYSVPSDYHIIFLPNEAVFSALPFNLNRFVNNSAIYLVNDAQSEFAYKEALKLNPKAVKVDELSKRQQVIPKLSEKPYYYYTYYDKLSLENGNIQAEPVPEEGQILVCNLNYCSHYENVNIEQHGIVFFESGRGIGLTGLSVVIVRKDLIGFQLGICPDMMCFQKSVTTKSIINTPYTLVPLLFAEYITYCDKETKSLQNVKSHLEIIKQQYIEALTKKTEVVPTKGAGIVKFRVPNALAEDQWKEFGWKFGDFMVIIIQEENEGKAEEFAKLIFQ